MMVNLKSVYIDYEVIVELYGKKFFYGIVGNVMEDSISLKKVRYVVDGKETPMGDQEKMIKFPANIMVALYPAVVNVTEVMINQPSNVYVYPRIQITFEDKTGDKTGEQVEKVTQEFDLKKKNEEYLAKETKRITDRAIENGEDPAKELEELNREYDGKKSFFDTTHGFKFGQKPQKPKGEEPPVKKEYTAAQKQQYQQQKGPKNITRGQPKGRDGKW